MKKLIIAQSSCLGALLVAVGSTVVFSAIGLLKTDRWQPAGLTGGDYVSAARPVVRAEQETWSAPGPIPRDPAWRYEVFTPPEIYYDDQTQQFTMSPPDLARKATQTATAGTAAGLALIKVERVPFRLQLVGYVGGAGRYLGTFENTATSEIFLAGAGRQLTELELQITDFDVRRERVALCASEFADEWVAVATVRDVSTGATTVLRHLERSFTNELDALLRDTSGRMKEFSARVGDVVEVGDERYTVVKLEINPPTVEVRKEAAGLVTTQLLTVAKAEPPLSQQSDLLPHESL